MALHSVPQAELAKQADLRKRGNEERAKNDRYGAWLEKDHIRNVDEQAHERRDPSKMHEGGIAGHGVPKSFTQDYVPK